MLRRELRACQRHSRVGRVGAVIPDRPQLVAGAGSERTGPGDRRFVIGLRRSGRAALRAVHRRGVTEPSIGADVRAVPRWRGGRRECAEIERSHASCS